MTEQPTVDIITLENYAECLSPWDPSASNHLYALVDMGSNGIRFSISDLTPPQSRLLRCVYRERAGISLFDALTGPSPTPGDQNGASHQSSGIARKPSEGPLVFPPEIIDQVAETLARFRRIADSYGVPRAQFSVLATEAMRRAANAGEMLTAIRNAAGIGIHVLAPPVETLFGAVMGSRSAFVDVARGGLFLDLGGGSVQMTWVDTTLPDYEIVAALAGESMPFGAARLIRVLEHQSEEVQALEKDKLRTSMQAAFAKLCDKFPDLKEASRTYAASNHSDSDSSGTLDELTGIDVYMCGGGFRGYGCMLMHNDPIKPYPIPSVGTYTVSGDFFKQTDRMRRTNTETEGKIYGMSARRRQQFPAIIEVVESFIEIVPNLRTVTFCAGSNRDGALLMKLPKSLRESNPLEVLAGITEAELPVARVALKALHDAVPSNKDLSTIPTIFSLGLGPLFARQIWVHQGEDDDANASYALHEAVTRDPSAPGLTHLARAVLGITVCARWGANLGPIDTVLHENLKSLIATVNHEAMFWAEYLGAVAAVMVDLVPVWPKSEDEIGNIIRFQATRDKTKKGKDRINLIVFISKDAGNGFDPDDVMNRIGKVGKVKGKKREIKVKARLQRLQT